MSKKDAVDKTMKDHDLQNPGLAQSLADRLEDPGYLRNLWPNLARDYPGLKLGFVSDLLRRVES